MKSRVVILSAFLTPFRSGAEFCAEEVAMRLSDKFDITIITARLRRDLPRNDVLQGKVPVIRVGLGLPLDKWLYPLLAPFAARKLHPQIIHAILETFAGLALHACTMIVSTAKQILTLQTMNRSFLKRHVLRTPNAVTAISNTLKKQAEELGRNDVVVIPNGAPYQDLRNACMKFRKVSGRILFVGRLEKMKGVDVLLAAFKTLPEGSHLHVVGEGSLRWVLEHANSDSRVYFLGRLDGDALYKEYAEAEIFCGLSRSEALGNVFLEAQAAGCAVIGTRVGGIPEIVRDGETGILVPPDNPTAAASALDTLLHDTKLRAMLSSSAIIAAQEFDWNAIAERYARVYE